MRLQVAWTNFRVWGQYKRTSIRRLLVLAVVVFVLPACAPGPYPLDFFHELHYSQSQRAQEPTRLLPPSESVPRTGAEIIHSTQAYSTMKNPVPVTSKGIAQAATIFKVNCSMCHGSQGLGDGTVGNFLVANGYGRPPDLTASSTKERTDGEIFGIVTNGLFVMPTFKNLLSEEERWLVVHYLRTLQ